MQIIGEKVKQARILRNLTITDLSDKLGISKQAVSQYETEQIEPKNETVFKMVWALDFPLEFFTRKYIDEINTKNTFFRALSSTNQLDKKTQEEKTKMVIRLYNFLNEYLDLPKLNLPTITMPTKQLSEFNSDDYDYIAMQIRSYWKLGEQPIKNVITVLEQNGIVVSTIKKATKKIDAFTQVHTVNGEMQFCIVIEDDKNSMARRNFSAAHELGHIILHSQVLNIDEMEKDKLNELETQANLFASAFLLPRQSFYTELTQPTVLNQYQILKNKWHVSMFAMIMRAKDLERINQFQFTKLIKEYSFKQYRNEEPLDDTIVVQQPSLFKQSLKLLLDNNVLTIYTLLKELEIRGMALKLYDIIDLLALDDNFFDPYKKEVPNDFVIKLRTEE